MPTSYVAEFINVDLVITSVSKLDLLRESFGSSVIVLHSGPEREGRRRQLLVLESASRRAHNPDAVIHALCAAVEALPPKARLLWDKSRRLFDLGCEMVAKERMSRLELRHDTLSRMTSLGANLTITYYNHASGTGDQTPPS